MIKKIVNTALDQEIVFDNIDFCLNKKDLGVSKAEHSTYQGYREIGESLTNSSLGSREISLTGFVFADNQAAMTAKKRLLAQITNPLQEIAFVLGDYQIKGRAQETVKFASNWEENNEFLAKFQLDILCVNPCWTTLDAHQYDMVKTLGKLIFPSYIPPEGFIFGETVRETIIEVNNIGDVSTGFELEFRAYGGAVSVPQLWNENTDEYMLLNITLQDGDVLKINTQYGQKGVWLNGTSRLNVWDWGGSFLQLAVGNNRFWYDADSGIDYLRGKLSYFPKIMGV